MCWNPQSTEGRGHEVLCPVSSLRLACSSPKWQVFHDMNLQFFLVLCNESLSPWVMCNPAHRNLHYGSVVCDLGQVSVPATPFISLIYLNYTQFGKSGWFLTVTGAVNALVLFLGEMRIPHWGNEVAEGRNGKSLPGTFQSRRKRLQILPMGSLCPHFIET